MISILKFFFFSYRYFSRRPLVKDSDYIEVEAVGAARSNYFILIILLNSISKPFQLI